MQMGRSLYFFYIFAEQSAVGLKNHIMIETLIVNWHMNPEILHLGPLSLRWYSVLFVSGFVLGWFIFKYFFRREGVPQTLLDPLLYTLLFGTIVGFLCSEPATVLPPRPIYDL